MYRKMEDSYQNFYVNLTTILNENFDIDRDLLGLVIGKFTNYRISLIQDFIFKEIIYLENNYIFIENEPTISDIKRAHSLMVRTTDS